jgi:uroporphyrinogen decarboxylase
VETSRERVIKALNHQESDRIPLDLGGIDVSGITGVAYNNLRNHLNLEQGRTQIFDVHQQIAKIEKDIRELLEIDTIPLLLEPRRWKASRLPDSSSCEIPEKWNSIKENDDLIVRDQQNNVIARMPQGGFYFEPLFTPLSKIEEPSQIENYLTYIESIDRPDYADESMDMIASRARKLYKKTDFAIIANLGLHLFTGGLTLRGYENFMMDLVSNKKLAHAILERLVNAHIKRCELYLDRVDQFIQVISVKEDLGTQQGPMISIDCYKEMIWPYQKKLFQFIKKKTGAFLLLHSCGSIYRFIPYFIEAGIDALNPIQVSAAEMDTKKLKKEFGNDITFWGGGCDTQQVLNRGSAKQIEEEVKRRIEDLAPGGGFVFTQVHNIQPDVSPANIMTMIEAFRKYRNYC